MSCWPTFRFLSGPIFVTPTRPNPTSMDVMDAMSTLKLKRLVDFKAWKNCHHLDVTSFLYVFVIWRKKGERPSCHQHPFHPNFANFCLKEPRHHLESSRNQDHLLWVASKKPSPNRPGIRPGETGGQIYPSGRFTFPATQNWHQTLLSHLVLGKIWKIWPEEIESPRDVENSWASS